MLSIRLKDLAHVKSYKPYSHLDGSESGILSDQQKKSLQNSTMNFAGIFANDMPGIMDYQIIVLPTRPSDCPQPETTEPSQ